jgi:predicted DNA-binding transcriptional regulator AlpA
MSIEHSPVRGRDGRQSDPLALMRPRQIADLFGVHVVTVWRWAKAGKLGKPVHLSPNVTAFRREHVEALIDSSET